LRLIN
jgi:hypothetical protein